MYKKIGVSLLALILMFNFTFKDYTEAAVASKVASQAAKQVAQEVIKDIALETAFKMALDEVGKVYDPNNEYKFKQGYHGYCVEIKKPDGTCDKPIQIKSELTETDKNAIKGQAGTELDKLLNGGSGVPKWQKFLDWFLPVWLISFGATALTYAFDSDVRSLFNEAAYNALVSLGIISPVSEYKKDMPIEEIELGKSKPVPEPDDFMTFQEWENSSTSNYINPAMSISPAYPLGQDVAVELNFIPSSDYVTDILTVLYKTSSSTYDFPHATFSNGKIAVKKNTFGSDIPMVSVAVNGQVVSYNGSNMGITTYSDRHEFVPTNTDISIHLKKANSILMRVPYEIEGFWYTDMLYSTVNGDTVSYQIRTETQPAYSGNIHTVYGSADTAGSGQMSKTALILHEKLKLIKTIQVPAYVDVPNMVDSPIAKSNYEDDTGKVALIPPSALTYKEESTGETVYRVPAAVPTNPPVFQKEDGTPVPEEQVTVDPAPTVKPAPNGSTTEKGEPIPEGTPIVTPAPTPSNPAPAPIPLTPAPTPTPTTPTPEPTTPVEPPTTGDPPTTGEPIPDGPSCEEKFKFPILSPLKETFSTSFPFSIPWDIERAINAAFSGIGHEKPKFNLDLNVLGQKETIEITTPKMFDDWKPFTDTLLVLTFDVLIMFGVYRFVKGAGS